MAFETHGGMLFVLVLVIVLVLVLATLSSTSKSASKSATVEPIRLVPVSRDMKTPPRKNDDGSGKRRTGAPESKQSNETFPRRSDPPGQAGLANETRPGLGTRREHPFPGKPGARGDARLPLPGDELPEDDEMTDNMAERQRSGREPNNQPLPREPQEQRSDSLEREQERSTGASGQLGA